MPAIIAAGAALAASSAVSTWIGGGVWGVWGAIAGGLAGGVVGQVVASAFGKPVSSSVLDGAARGTLINTASTAEPIPVVYGRRRVGGPVVLRYATDVNNALFYKIVVLSEGEIRGARNVYIDDDPVVLDDATLTSSRHYNFSAIEVNAGTDAQAASVYLRAQIPSYWATTDTLAGIAYLACGFSWSADVYQGEPVVTADVMGRKVYDPRDTVTKWHHNPALCIRDYLTNTRYGKGIPSARIDDTSFNAAANICEERVAVPTHTAVFTATAADDTLTFADAEIFGYGDGVTLTTTGTLPAGLSLATTYYVIVTGDDRVRLATSYANAIADTQINVTDAGTGTHTMHHVDAPRYTLDGVVNIDQTPLQNLQQMLVSCRSTLVFSGGLYKLKIDQAETATSFEFNEDNITGGWQFQLGGKRSRFNRVKCRIFNPAARWQPDVVVWDSTSLRTADNGLLLEQTFDAPFCTNVYRGAHLAQAEGKQSRYGIVVSFLAFPVGLRAEVGDVVPITHTTPGWVSKKFRIVEMELQPDDLVRVTAREYNAAVYTIDALTEADLAPDTTLPSPYTVSAPTSPVLSEVLVTHGDGTKAPWARLAWTASTDGFVTEYEVQGKLSTDANWIGLGKTNAVYMDRGIASAGQTVNARVRTINSWGAVSAWATATPYTIVGDTGAPAAPTALAAAGSLRAVRLTWTNPADTDYAYTEVWEHTADVRASATKIATVAGTAYDRVGLPAGVSTRYYWTRAVDFSGNVGAWNASTGVSAATTQVDGADFTTSIGAIEIVGALPGTGLYEGRVAYLTTDNKLYRYDGASWIRTTDGADLVANSVTAASMNVATLSAITANLGTVTAGDITASSNINTAGYINATGGTDGGAGLAAINGFPSTTNRHGGAFKATGTGHGLYGWATGSGDAGRFLNSAGTGYAVYAQGNTSAAAIKTVAGSGQWDVDAAGASAGNGFKGWSIQLTATTGTAPLVVASTTNVANLNASSLNGATFAAPGPIGGMTSNSVKTTTVDADAAGTRELGGTYRYAGASASYYYGYGYLIWEDATAAPNGFANQTTANRGMLSQHLTHNLGATAYKLASVPSPDTTGPYLYFNVGGKVCGFLDKNGLYTAA